MHSAAALRHRNESKHSQDDPPPASASAAGSSNNNVNNGGAKKRSSSAKGNNNNKSAAGARSGGRGSCGKWMLILVVLSGLCLFLYSSGYNDKSSTTSGAKKLLRKTNAYLHHHHSSAASSPYAYVYLLAGCDPRGAEPAKYRLFLYSIYVNIRLLRKYGSTADMIVYYGMKSSSDANDHDAGEDDNDDLPPHELDVLRHKFSNVKVRKLPRSVSQSFYTIQLNKFRILGLTDYRRVLYMDADVLPLVNLDFFFELSDPLFTHPDPPRLQGHMAYRTYLAPMNGGFFMVTPFAGDLEQVQQLITHKERVVNDGGKFDPHSGWGDRDVAHWEGHQRNGTGWTWWGANGDQGLIYHWFHHVKRSYSLVLPGGVVQNWIAPSASSAEEDEAGAYDKENDDDTDDVGGADDNNNNKDNNDKDALVLKDVVHLDENQRNVIYHFTGEQKPWYKGCPDDPSAKLQQLALKSGSNGGGSRPPSPILLWCATLDEVIRDFGLGIHLEDVRAELKRYTTADVRQTKGLVTNLLD